MKLPNLLPTRYRLGQARSSGWHTVSLAALAATIAVLPWISWPSAGDRFELPKLLILSIGVGIAFLAWLTGVIAERVVVVPASLPFAGTIAVLAGLALSGITATHFSSSVFGLGLTRPESALAQLTVVLMGILLALQLRSIADVRRFGVLFLFTTGLLAFVSLYQLEGISIIPILPKGFTFLADDPHSLAVIAALGVTLGVFFVLRGVERLSKMVRWGLLVLLAVLLLALQTKLGFALTLVGLVLVMVPVWWRPGAFTARSFLVPSLGLGLTVLALLLLPLSGAPGTLSPNYSNAVALSTLTSTRAATGVGPGLYPVAFNLLRPDAYNRTTSWTVRPQSAGTELSDRAASQGVIGTLALLVLVGSLLVALWRRVLTMDSNDPEYAVVAPIAIGLTLLAVSAVLTPWTTALHFYFWLFVGFGIAVSPKKRTVLTLDRGWPVPWLRIALPVASIVVLLTVAGWARVAWGDHLLGSARRAIQDTQDLTAVRGMLDRAMRANPLDPEPAALSGYAAVVESQLASGGASGKPTAAALAEGFALARRSIRAAPGLPEPIENLLAIARQYGGVPESEATAWFVKLTQLDPKNPAVYLSQGQFLYSIGTSDTQSNARTEGALQGAVTAFQRAAALKADLPEARYGEAVALRALGKNAEAEPLLRALLQQFPNQPAVSLALGLAQNSQKKFSDAAAALEPVVTADPTNAALALALSDAYVGLDRKADAKAVLEAAANADANKDNAALKEALDKLPK